MKLLKTTIFLLFTQLSFGQNKVQKIDSLFSNLYNSNKFNGNVLIAEKGNIIYKKSFGLANENSKEKLNENSIFELASCTKPFTAMAIMILKEQGKLNIDDKITKYLPQLSNYNDITIKNLVNHTGGLPDYMSIMNTSWDKTKIATNKDVINTLSELQPNELFVPNTKVEYSNTGYVLLALIIEKVSGQTYADFLESKVFKPLKMTRTFVNNGRLSPKKINNYASGYIYVDGKYILPDDFDRTKFVIWLDGVVGDGSINSTTIDLLKWDRALYTNTLVSKESMKDIFNNGTLNDGTLTKHAFGWRVLKTEPFGKIARHSGGWPGYVTYIERNLDSDKTVIILQNHYNRTMPKQKIRNILYGMPLPKTMEQLYMEGKSVDEIITLIENPTSKYLIDDFYENSITTFGYQLLKQDKNEEALKVFKYITISYPKSSNAFDSLGECFLKLGEKYRKEGVKAYEKSLELDPNNENAKSVLYNQTNIKKGLNILFKENTDTFTTNQKILIDSILVTSEREIRILLPNLPKDIKVTVSITNENVEQLGGVNGRTERNSPAEVIIEISKIYPGGITKAIQTALAALIFHEFHHLSRGWAIYDNKYEQGILIATINEGLAVVFSETYTDVKLTGNSSSNVTMEWVKEIMSLPKDANYGTWMSKHPDGRTAIGYRTGNFIVKQAMKNSGMDILEISKQSPDSITKMAGY